MENDNYNSAYQERIQKLFERVNNIHNYSEEEKMSKIKELETVINSIADHLEKKKETRETQIDTFSEKIKQLKLYFEEESSAKKTLESKLQNELESVERFSNKVIEESKANRDEVDKRLVHKLNNAIDLIQIEIPKNLKDKSFDHQKELDQILKVELPLLQNELNNECQLRKELEAKIYEQFMEQIKELTDLYIEEKRIRELKEEEILSVINSISKEVDTGLKKQRVEREKSEENILELVERVIERLKRDISN